MIALTARQRRVLDAIADHQRAHGYPPTIRELGAALGIRSTNGVNDHLAALEVKGYLRRDPTVSRGLVLTTPPGADIETEIARLRGEIAERQRALAALRFQAVVERGKAEARLTLSTLGRGGSGRGEAGKVPSRASKRHGGMPMVEGAE